MRYHTPVLLLESVEGLNIDPNGIYVDATFGGGGHSMEILKHLKGGRLLAFDQDPEARKNLPEDKRLLFLHQNFRFLENNLKYHGIKSVDGILADLGVSSHQFDEGSRGFSFRSDGPLDMRMNTGADMSAEHVINHYSTEKLEEIFYNYGELKNARRLTALIDQARKEKVISRTGELVKILEPAIPQKHQNKFLAKVFQALRIEVNLELESLKEFLVQSQNLLQEGGRLVVITYHSLEDRLVKNFIRAGNFEGSREVDLYGNQVRVFDQINRKVVVPGAKELESNPRSRSAKLRIAEKI